MEKKRIIIWIVILMLLIVIPFALSTFLGGTLKRHKAQLPPTPTEELGINPTYPPTNLPQTSLWLEINPDYDTSDGNIPLAIYMGTAENLVKGVALEIAYDPKVLQFVSIEWADRLEGRRELIKKIDPEMGRITFTTDVSDDKEHPFVTADDEIGELVFKPIGTKGTKTEVRVLPQSFITAEGITGSALVETDNITVTIN